VFAKCSGGLCGLATCFGASTVMLGSGAEPVVVCDTAGPHSKTVDKIATAEGATKLDDNLMTRPSIRDGNAFPIHGRYHTFRNGSPRVEKISADASVRMGIARHTRLGVPTHHQVVLRDHDRRETLQAKSLPESVASGDLAKFHQRRLQ
jgi:hypothetical protein